VKRRAFITLLGGAAAARPLAARAQQAGKVWRIGWLSGSSREAVAGFRQGLRDFGYIEGQNLIIEYRSAAERADRQAELAAELVAAKVDVIFAAGSEATRAARQKTTTIPIVMTSTNPVGLGFVASIARPGGNVTGLSLLGPETGGKRLQLLKEMIPRVAKVAVLRNPDDPAAQFSLKETQAAAETLMVKLQILEARDVDAFDGAFLAATKEGCDAAVLLPAPLMSRNAARIADLAMQRRMPTLFYSEDSVKAGELVSYGANSTRDAFSRARSRRTSRLCSRLSLSL
jgi:putative tryptophan/tyrosine transport system substrate-binding protein